MLVGFLLSVPVDIESKKKETRQEEASRAPLVLTQPQTLIVPVRKTAKSNDLLSVNCQDKIIIYAYINLDLLLIKNFQKRTFFNSEIKKTLMEWLREDVNFSV